MKIRKWSVEEIEKLKHEYWIKTLPELSELFGRSKNSIANKCLKLGLRGKGQPNKIVLTENDKLWLKLNYPYMSNAFIGYRLNCGWRTVVRLAREMGLTKASQFMKEAQAYTAKRAKESHLKNGTYPPKGWYSPNLQKGEPYRFKKLNND